MQYYKKMSKQNNSWNFSYFSKLRYRNAIIHASLNPCFEPPASWGMWQTSRQHEGSGNGTTWPPIAVRSTVNELGWGSSRQWHRHLQTVFKRAISPLGCPHQEQVRITTDYKQEQRLTTLHRYTANRTPRRRWPGSGNFFSSFIFHFPLIFHLNRSVLQSRLAIVYVNIFRPSTVPLN